MFSDGPTFDVHPSSARYYSCLYPVDWEVHHGEHGLSFFRHAFYLRRREFLAGKARRGTQLISETSENDTTSLLEMLSQASR